ncbi:MAG: histidine triad nucleotide-binding protein [bacterium]
MAEDCLFCKIVAGDIPSERVYEDKHCIAFKDINPQAPLHLLIIPRRHIAGVNEVSEDHKELMGHLIYTAGQVAKDQGVSDSGYRLVVNTNRDARQDVFHLHVHLLGKRLLGWPPG